MSLLWRRRGQPVGVDIRQNEIRIARLGRLSRTRFCLDCADIGWLERTPSTLHAQMDWPALGNVMSRMVKQYRLQGQPAVVTLPASGVKMQRMQLPGELQSYAVEAAIQGRLRYEMPGLTETVCIDYLMLASAGSEEKNVYYAAARQALLAQYVNCVASAGLEVKVVDVDVCALVRLFSCQQEKICLENTVYAIFVELNEIAEFIVYNSQIIVFHQIERTDNKQTASVMLKDKLQKFHAKFPELCLQKVIVSSKSIGDLGSVEANGLQMVRVNPYELFKLTSQAQAITHEYPDDLLVACGSAMRELPAWS